MANFVEQATLLLVDKSSGKIRAVNKALKELFATAKQGRNIRINLSGLEQASAKAKRLTRDLQELRRVSQGSGSTALIRVPDVSPAKIQRINDLTAALRRYSSVARGIPGVEFPRAPRLGGLGGMGGIGPMGGMRPGMMGAGAVAGTIGLDINPMRLMLNGFIFRLGSTIEQAIIRGFAQGTRDIDIAETRIGLQQIPQEQQSLAQSIAAQVARDFQVISRGQALGLVGELLPVVRPEPGAQGAAALGTVSTELAKFIELRVALGDTAESAVDSAIDLAKAGEQMGRFTDAAGNIDVAGVQDFFRTINQGFALIGKEATPELLRALAKSLRTSRLTLDNEGLLASLFLAEESGSTAGVGINQAIKTLTGERTTKKVLNNLEALGLITTKQVEAGAVGDQAITELVGGGAVDEADLRRNILSWIVSNVIPKMREQGLDPSEPVDVARFAGQISSERTATEAISQLILRSDELLKNIARAQEIDPSRFGETTGQSLLVAAQEAQSQLTGILGEVGNSFKDILIPALNSVAGIANSLGAFIAGPEGEGSMARSAATVAGAGALGAGAFLGGRALLSALNPFSVAATGLTTAGTSLQVAAAQLSAVARMQGAGLGSMPGGPAGGAAGGKPAGIGLGRGLLSLLTFGTAAVMTVDRIEVKELSQDPATRAKQLEEAEATRKRIDTEQNRPFESLLDQTVGQKFTDLLISRAGEVDTAQADSLKAELAKLTAAIQNAQELGFTPDPEALARRDTLQQQISAMGAPGAESVALLSATPDMFSQTFTAGNAALMQTDSLFDQTFATGAQAINTGAQAIQNAGATLGPTLQSAIAAGGEQAAANIRGALSAPISVNVNAPPPRLDTGAVAPN